jgi:hypothetical protein
MFNVGSHDRRVQSIDLLLLILIGYRQARLLLLLLKLIMVTGEMLLFVRIQIVMAVGTGVAAIVDANIAGRRVWNSYGALDDCSRRAQRRGDVTAICC